MKAIIVNLILFFVLFLISLFIAAGIITLLVTNIPFDLWSIGIVLLGIICLFLMIYYPIRLCILEIIRDYKQYRSKRPVKILYWVKSKLDK
jgi:hypothetical protein